jgi:RNA polymerase sigma-70 factor (ECF subfamily)
VVSEEVKWLIAREIPRLRRYAFSLVHDAESADDLVQDCLERAIRKRHLWYRQGSIRGWLFRILYNVFLNQLRRRAKDRQNVELDEMTLTGDDSAEQERQAACTDIMAAMEELPDEQRAAIVLTAVEGLSYDEAAEVLGVPIGTLRSRLSRGRERLRDRYVPHPSSILLRRVK